MSSAAKMIELSFFVICKLEHPIDFLLRTSRWLLLTMSFSDRKMFIGGLNWETTDRM